VRTWWRWRLVRRPDYLAWPYHCADGVRCPLALRYRVLVVTGCAATGHSTRCRLRARFTVELLEGGRLAAVQGNGATATVEGDLPEGDGEHPSFTRAWLWRNWCGSGNVSLRVGGPGGAVIPARTLQRPACADPGKPSTLEPTPLPIRPNG
jgi:hypothetical protein